jgi:hypothetical protein
MRRLLERHWSPAGVTLPKQPLSEEASAAIIRITGSNFRLSNRLRDQRLAPDHQSCRRRSPRQPRYQYAAYRRPPYAI